MARHRAPSGRNASFTPQPDQPPAPQARPRGAHRLPRPSHNARGRIVVAAVAVGAVTAATQAADLPADDQPVQPRALPFDSAALTFASPEQNNPNEPDNSGPGSGSSARTVDPAVPKPAGQGFGGQPTLTQQLPLPEVVPVPERTQKEDLQALEKGVEVARERAEAALRQAIRNGASQLPVAPDAYVAPTVGTITSCFCMRWGSFHSGIDIANSIGTPIYSVTEGEVIAAGPASGFGLWIKVRHPSGAVTVYGHLHEVLVSVGEHVVAGEQIATMGSRGYSTGPHLHFEVWQGGEDKIDPMAWLHAHGVDM